MGKRRAKGEATFPDEPDWGLSPREVEDKVRRLVALDAAGETVAPREHVWVMSVPYALDSDEEAQRIAAERETARLGGEAFMWTPPDEGGLYAYGPHCLSCGKIRGPLPAITACQAAPPPEVQKMDVDKEMAGLSRDQRREVQIRRRREAAGRHTSPDLSRQFGKPARELVKAETLRSAVDRARAARHERGSE